jgi:ferric-dicitrate binding protein FerR (iron transport regulator)
LCDRSHPFVIRASELQVSVANAEFELYVYKMT